MDEPVWESVIADMRSRDQVGRRRYGVPLTASTPVDHLLMAYEEALDLCVYLKAESVRRDQGWQ